MTLSVESFNIVMNITCWVCGVLNHSLANVFLCSECGKTLCKRCAPSDELHCIYCRECSVNECHSAS